jgi:hypothetical protein
MPDKINPRALKLAKRQANAEAPESRERIVTPRWIKIPSENISFSLLEGDYGRQVLGEYNQRVSRNYMNNSALQVLSFADNVVKGGNPYAFVLLNWILREDGKWVARPCDLEKALRENAINLRDTYGDSALVLRSNGEPNTYLANKLTESVRQTSSFTSSQSPYAIPLTELGLVSDPNAPNGLVFRLSSNLAEVINAPQLDNKNDLAKFNNCDDNGLPIFDKSGSRTLYTCEGGLTRLIRYGILNLDAGNGGLAGSVADGRVIVCAEGTHAKNRSSK